jgi:hypothetical protein
LTLTPSTATTPGVTTLPRCRCTDRSTPPFGPSSAAASLAACRHSRPDTPAITPEARNPW